MPYMAEQMFVSDGMAGQPESDVLLDGRPTSFDLGAPPVTLATVL